MDINMDAMEMYNHICELEDLMASGVEIEDLDIDLMNKTKDDCKEVLQNNLDISVI